MNDPQFISLRNFSDEREANDLIDLLEESGIKAILSKDSGDLDSVFIGEAPTSKFEVLIKPSEQTLAEELLSDAAEKHLTNVEPDYYLLSFSEQELIDVLIQRNEWSEFDVLLSQKLLTDRGVEISETALIESRQKRDQELAKPAGGQVLWIILGYIFAVMGGFFGLPVGFFLWKSQNKLPNGTKVPAYKESIRKHGLAIFLISIVVFPTVFFVRLFTEISLFAGY